MILRLLLFAVWQIAAWQVLEPDGDTVWRAGQQVTIKWNNEESAPYYTAQLVDVDLMVGPGDGVVVMSIAASLPSTQLQAEWTVSQFLSTRSDYFIRLSHSNNIVIAAGERFNVVSPAVLGTVTTNRAGYIASGSKIAALLSTIILVLIFAQ